MKIKGRKRKPSGEELVSAHKLDMKLVDVEYSFDAGKIVFLLHLRRQGWISASL